MTSTTLRGSTRTDLLAVPAVMLGFHPRESLVVLGLRGSRVEFVARLDTGHPPSELLGVAGRIERALAGAGCDVVAVLGYGQDMASTAESLRRLASLMATPVVEALVTDGHSYWELGTDDPLAPGTPYDVRSCSLLAQSVYVGMSVCGSRDEAIADVLPPPAHRAPEIAERLDDAAQFVDGLEITEQLQLCSHLLGSPIELGDGEAAQLVCLLGDTDVVGAVLADLGRSSAPRIRGHLLSARRTVLGPRAANVIGLLGISCWLAGEGAQQTECMEQLAVLDQQSLLLGILQGIHAEGLAPTQWDSWGRRRAAPPGR